MKDSLHIPIVLGTARKGRKSELVAHYILSLIKSYDAITTEFVDIKDHVTQPFTVAPVDEKTSTSKNSKWKTIIQKSNALILVVPEYNHGYPGELKLLLDSLYTDYKYMPVGIVGVSVGMLGGARVIDHLKPVLSELNFLPIPHSVIFPKVEEAFNENGSIANSASEKNIHSMTTTLIELADALRSLRATAKI